MNRGNWKTMITAHAGAEGTQPNTLESICELVHCGADFVEVDVRMRDGVLLLSHDPLQENRDYDTLEEAFQRIAEVEGLRVNVDLKEEGLIRRVEEVAQRSGMGGRYLFTGSVGDAEIAYVQAEHLKVWYNGFLLSPEAAKDPVKSVEAKGFQVLNTYFGMVTDRMLEETPERLSIWTVQDESMMRRFLQAGVQNITTRLPSVALRLREEIQAGH